MEDKQILNLILNKLESIDGRLNTIDNRLEKIETVQAKQSKKLDVIYEQTGKNTELESTVKELVEFKNKVSDAFKN